MPFEISPEELWEMAWLEEEAGWDREAGFDWGAKAGEYLSRIPAKVESPEEEDTLGQ